MSGRPLLLGPILAAVALNAAAQILLRVGAGALPPGSLWRVLVAAAREPAICAGLALYGVSVVAWIWVLGRAEVSFAYPFLGLGFVAVAFAGWALLGEELGARKIVATVLIVAGVALMASGGRDQTPSDGPSHPRSEREP